MFARRSVVLAAAGVALLLAVVGVQAANSLIVQTDKGAVQGASENGVDRWRGIPYAAPPVGNLRFALPEAHAPWSGVLQTTEPAQICPQLQIIPGLWSGAEDCLYADVWAPANITKPLPVLFWIYGGGWQFGDGIEFGLYDATNFVNAHQVIVVTFNYRLSSLGFLALKAAKDENKAGSVGSYGIYDQIAMLHWVQTNIGAFGGDPEQVTIAGESAGAFSTCIHLASPLSRGLFRAAIMESGTCSSEIFFQAQDESMAWSDTFASLIGCDPSQPDAAVLECIRQADLNKIMGPDLPHNATGPVPLMYPLMPWGATIDGVLLKDIPLNVLRRGEGNPVKAVLMGTNHDEGTIFAAGMADVVPQMHKPLQFGDLDFLMDHFFGGNQTVNQLVAATYPDKNFANATSQIETVLRDYFFVCPTSRAALALDAAGVTTFVYQFVYKGDWIEDPYVGVYHSAELEFVFDNPWPPLIHTFSARDQTMANTFGAYWSGIVKYMNPNGASAMAGSSAEATEVNWPPYGYSSSLQSMELDVPSSVVSGLLEDKCLMWDKISQYAPPTAIKKFKHAARNAGIATE